MKIDNLDLDIIDKLNSLDEDETLSTTDLAKYVFDIENGDTDRVRVKTNMVRSRLEQKLVPQGLVDVKSDGRKNLYVPSGRTSTPVSGEVTLEFEDGERKDIDLSRVILIQFGDEVRLFGIHELD